MCVKWFFNHNLWKYSRTMTAFYYENIINSLSKHICIIEKRSKIVKKGCYCRTILWVIMFFTNFLWNNCLDSTFFVQIQGQLIQIGGPIVDATFFVSLSASKSMSSVSSVYFLFCLSDFKHSFQTSFKQDMRQWNYKKL